MDDEELVDIESSLLMQVIPDEPITVPQLTSERDMAKTTATMAALGE